MIHLFMPFNNLSGSCVAFDKLSRLLFGNKIAMKNYAPEGYFRVDNNVPELRLNPFSHLLFFYFSIKGSTKNDILVFNTFVCVFPAFFASYFRRSYLYLHEDVSRNVFIMFILRVALYISPMRLLVVNPELGNLFKGIKSITISNFYEKADFYFSKPYDQDFLMVSNALIFKGVLDFVEIAKRNPKKKFVLLTNDIKFYDNVEIPSNLLLTENQEIKESLLLRSRFIVNLSKANETFGLSTFEGVCRGLFPITFENSGSRYMLGQDYPFLKSIDDFEMVCSTILNDSSSFAGSLENRISKMFSSESVVERLRTL